MTGNKCCGMNCKVKTPKFRISEQQVKHARLYSDPLWAVKRETFHNSGFSVEGTFISAAPNWGQISASSVTDKNCTKGKSKVQRWRSNVEQRTLMEAKNQWRWVSVQRGRTDKSHHCGKLNGRVTHPLCEDGWIARLNHVFQFLIGCRSPSCRQASKTRMPSVIIIIIIKMGISTVHIYPAAQCPKQI